MTCSAVAKSVALACFLTLQIGSSCARAGSVNVRAYFGEPVSELDDVQQSAFERGQTLFVKKWDESTGAMRNAESCVSCHSVPMPGGSGMSEQALVPFSSGGTLQRKSPGYHSKSRKFSEADHRRTPPLFGIGLLEHSRADNSQNIFGAFAEMNSLESFVARAFAVELGISNNFSCARPSETSGFPERCEPKISNRSLNDVVTFIRFLAAPPDQYKLADKESVFLQLGCAVCHTTSRKTSHDAPTAIREKSFSPFTDLKTHDLGKVRALRTAPLWGLNSYGPPYLHDGSANSIEDAIVRHAGEASASRDKYLMLDEQVKAELLAFLRSL